MKEIKELNKQDEILKLEITLSFAHKKDNNMKIFGNIAGAFNEFFNKMEEEYDLDNRFSIYYERNKQKFIDGIRLYSYSYNN